MPTTASNNPMLLEFEIVEALREEGKAIGNNRDGDPCAVHVNIRKLAEALSKRGVSVTPGKAISIKVTKL